MISEVAVAETETWRNFFIAIPIIIIIIAGGFTVWIWWLRCQPNPYEPNEPKKKAVSREVKKGGED